MMAGSMRVHVLAEAQRWVGTPYRHQASSIGVGCDCLGLIRGVWRALYGYEPEDAGTYAADWAEAGGVDRLLQAARRHMIELTEAETAPGDMLLFRWRPHLPAKHLAILADRHSIIHAYQRHAVAISPLVGGWRRRIAGRFAFPPSSRNS